MSEPIALPILYKYTEKGQIQQWQIKVQDDKFWTIEGIKDGKLTTSLPTVCTGKNIGKKNETTPREQAVLEAQAKHTKKLDKYARWEDLKEEKKFLEPMLAFVYDKYPIDWDAVKEGKIKVFGQPKLDGLRDVNENNTQMSRNGKPFLSTPHLNQNKMTLDGELYSHEYKEDFNKIVSLVKKQKPTPEELAESAEKVEYWIYDFPKLGGTFSQRFVTGSHELKKINNPKFKLVPTQQLLKYEHLEEFHAKNLADGYEGTIIRVDNAPYEFKRSKQLLKFKDFQDEEFKIKGYEEGEGGRTGTIGKFWMDFPEGKGSKEFKSNVKGNFDYLRQVWKDRDSYIGKTATIKFFGYTPLKEDGTGAVPRFPFVIKINREEYE